VTVTVRPTPVPSRSGWPTADGRSRGDRERIFERFVRERGGTSAGPAGLYVSRECAGMGGDLVLERSRPGDGSTFLLSLPRLTRTTTASPWVEDGIDGIDHILATTMKAAATSTIPG